jgi:hypothetical protein
MDTPKKNPTEINKSDKNPNHFPEETLSQQRELADEGDDMREPYEEGAGNNGAEKTTQDKPVKK